MGKDKRTGLLKIPLIALTIPPYCHRHEELHEADDDYIKEVDKLMKGVKGVSGNAQSSKQGKRKWRAHNRMPPLHRGIGLTKKDSY